MANAREAFKEAESAFKKAMDQQKEDAKWMTFKESFEKHALELFRKHQIASEEFTQKQIAEILRQLIASGDLKKYVKTEEMTTDLKITYLPYSGVNELHTRIYKLEKLLEENGIEILF